MSRHCVLNHIFYFFQADIVNKSIFDLSFEDDRPRLYSLLQNPGSAVDPMQPVGKGMF